MFGKQLSINQLQFRAFFLVVLLFAVGKFAYRTFIERPNIERTLSTIIENDINDISEDITQHLAALEMRDYSYSILSESYDYVTSPSPEFEENQLSNNIFFKFKVDGVLFVDEHLETVFKKGINQDSGEPLNFDIDDFQKYPLNRNLFQPMNTANQFTPLSGVISTNYGPALFSSAQIKGEEAGLSNQGYVLFLKLIDDSLLSDISKDTDTVLSIGAIQKDFQIDELADWRDVKAFVSIVPKNQRIVRDVHGNAIALFTIEHTAVLMPSQFDLRALLYIILLMILLLVLHLFVKYSLVTPIQKLSNQVSKMNELKEVGELNESGMILELELFAKNFNRLVRKLKLQEEKLSQQAFLDALTDVPNRRAFDLHIAEQVQLYHRHQIPFCVIMADIDYFKKYNDSLGHQAGDEALIEVASILSTFSKRSNDLCARYGGEEFVLVFSDVNEKFVEETLAKVEDKFKEVAIHHPESNVANYITLSLGACIVSASDHYDKEHSITESQVISIADKALYEAKEAGRNRYIIKHY